MSEERLKALMEQQQLELKNIMESYQASQAAAAAPSPDDVETNSVAIRLPNFWANKPELWFAQIEANFEARSPKITTEASRYAYALQALPQDVLTEVEHVVATVSTEKYTLLKRALLKAYGRSPAKKNAELLAMTARPGGIGDRKPSNLLMKIRTLSGASYDALERAMFLNQLPHAVRTALANSKAASNDDLAVEADNVMEEFQLGSASLAAPHSVSSVDRTVEVDAASFRPKVRPDRQEGRRPQADLCFIHKRYGKQAYTCRSSSCPMRDILAAPPPSTGNGRAGRQ